MQDERFARLYGSAPPAQYPRPFRGVRLKLAKEFVGFTDDDDRKFRSIAQLAGVDTTPAPDSGSQKAYSPKEIRKIRRYLERGMLVMAQSMAPALMVFRITKGGVGKTTLCANIAVCLALFGFKVLVIDGDSQGSISHTLGYNIDRPDLVHIGTLMERMSRGQPTHIRDATVPLYEGGMLDLIPADITLANEAWMYNDSMRGTLFERLMKREAEFFNQYDVVMVDCAPGTTMLANAFMAAAETVTAVVTPEPQALLGLFGLESNLAEINMGARSEKTPAGMHIVVNRFSSTFAPHADAVDWLVKEYGACLNPNAVRTFVGFMREANATDFNKSAPLMEKEPTSAGSRSIIELTKSLIQLYGVKLKPSTNEDTFESEAA